MTGAENAVMARISESMLLVGSPLLPHLLCCTDTFTACHWRPLALSGGAWRAKHLAAGGLYKHEGVLWIVTYSVLKPGSNDLYFCKFHDRKLHRYCRYITSFKIIEMELVMVDFVG